MGRSDEWPVELVESFCGCSCHSILSARPISLSCKHCYTYSNDDVTWVAYAALFCWMAYRGGWHAWAGIELCQLCGGVVTLSDDEFPMRTCCIDAWLIDFCETNDGKEVPRSWQFASWYYKLLNYYDV